jgi:3'-5' exoribonuclease
MEKVMKLSEVIPDLTKVNVGTDVFFMCIIKSYRVALTSKNTQYITGVVGDKQLQVNIKIWDNTVVQDFVRTDLQNQICVMHGVIKEYNNQKEIHVTQCGIATDADINDFVRTCDISNLFNEFKKRLSELPIEWQEVVIQVFNSIPDAWNRFVVAYAAAGYHDALRGGLLHHTVKMLRIWDVVMTNDTRLQKYSDLMKVGIMLHDLGKIEEMSDGAYVADAFINHRMRGMGYIMSNKEFIQNKVGVDNYNRLCSIMLEHHGGIQAEPMHTVYALMLYVVDNLDAQMTYVADSVDNNMSGKLTTMSNGNIGIKYDTTYLIY